MENLKDKIRTILYFLTEERKKADINQNSDLIKLLESDIAYNLRSDIKNKFEMNRKIKIFVASESILLEERKLIEGLIRSQNDRFIDENIYLTPFLWENSDKGTGNERKQNEYNRELRSSDVLIVLTWGTIGTFTNEEMEVGFQNLEDTGKPYRIYSFNKKVPRYYGKEELAKANAFFAFIEFIKQKGAIITDFSDDATLIKEINLMFETIKNSHNLWR